MSRRRAFFQSLAAEAHEVVPWLVERLGDKPLAEALEARHVACDAVPAHDIMAGDTLIAGLGLVQRKLSEEAHLAVMRNLRAFRTADLNGKGLWVAVESIQEAGVQVGDLVLTSRYIARRASDQTIAAMLRTGAFEEAP